jgi:hypothetical protein
MPGRNSSQHNGRLRPILPIADAKLCGSARLVAGRSMTSPGQRPRHPHMQRVSGCEVRANMADHALRLRSVFGLSGGVPRLALRPCCRMSDLWLASHYGGAMEGSRHGAGLPRLPGTELM